MRRSTLLLLLAVTACDAGQEDTYFVVEDFAERAKPAPCEAVTVGPDVAVSEIRSATDSTWLLLDEPQRRVLELDAEMRTVWSLEYPTLGPGSVARAVSATLLGDSAVALADRGGLALVILSRTGEPLGSTPLGFMPNTVASTPTGEVLVTPLRVGDDPATLLLSFRGSESRELPVPPRYYENVLVRALGNSAIVETLPDGRALVLHEYLAPRGFSVDPEGNVTSLSVPTPDATLHQVDYVPTVPLREEQQPHIMLPALGLAVDRLRSEVFLMTRSGQTVENIPQRAIFRLDDRLGFLEAYTIDVPASRMAVLSRRGVAIVADDEDHLYTCRLPISGGAHARAE